MCESVWAIVGTALAAFAIWLTVRLINTFRPQRVAADLLTFRLLLIWTGMTGAAVGFSVDSTSPGRELAAPVVRYNLGNYADTFLGHAAFIALNLKGTIAGTGVGLLFGWLISRRDISLPTDDSGSR
jgi:hypothetical protein